LNVITGEAVFWTGAEECALLDLFQKSRQKFREYEKFNYFITKADQPEIHGVVVDGEEVCLEAPHRSPKSKRYVGCKRDKELAQAFRYLAFVKPIIEGKTIHIMRETKLKIYKSVDEWSRGRGEEIGRTEYDISENQVYDLLSRKAQDIRQEYRNALSQG